MTVDERMAAARRHIRDPPLCHCGVCATLVMPPHGNSRDNRPKYFSFFRCSLKTLDGWPVCQFNEYVQGRVQFGQVMSRCVRMRPARLHGRVQGILTRDASVVSGQSKVWFPRSLVMDGIAATEMLNGRAGLVIGNGLVFMRSFGMG
ncbi:hypothetical protein HU200_051222 [Digitaria exilis]|uniref:Uncharacterized protein n=1 Tax=Digitaria exilis TaxID=1010633 RepID=A0A835E8J5_9POAL|nr:hypothetical protein HU200_051222 [Digitaria exilis]